MAIQFNKNALHAALPMKKGIATALLVLGVLSVTWVGVRAAYILGSADAQMAQLGGYGGSMDHGGGDNWNGLGGQIKPRPFEGNGKPILKPGSSGGGSGMGGGNRPTTTPPKPTKPTVGCAIREAIHDGWGRKGNCGPKPHASSTDPRPHATTTKPRPPHATSTNATSTRPQGTGGWWKFWNRGGQGQGSGWKGGQY